MVIPSEGAGSALRFCFLLELVSVPINGALETFLEVDLGLETEEAAGLGHVGDSKLHVRGVAWQMVDGRSRLCDPDDERGEAVDRDRRPWVPEVEGVSDGLGALEAEDHPLDEIVDITPGADLVAFVVHVKGLVLEGANDEIVNGAFTDLPWTKDIEGANGERWQFLCFPIVVGEMLGRELRHGVGPPRLANGAEGGDVAFGDPKGVATEDLGGREVDEALQVLDLDGCFERIERPFEGDLHRQYGVLDHRIDTGDGGHVNHGVASLHGVAERLCIADVTCYQRNIRIFKEFRPFDCISTEVVENDHLVCFGQPTSQRSSNESRAAGEEDFFFSHHERKMTRMTLTLQ
jgi:hypothetical protein